LIGALEELAQGHFTGEPDAHNTYIHTKQMKPKYFIAGLIAFSTIIGWNILLIQRDNKMYEGYNKRFNQIKYDHPTLKEVSQ